MKDAAKLPGAQARGLRQLLDRQWTVKVLLGVGESGLDAIRFRFKFKQSRELRLAPCPTMIEDELPGDRQRSLLTEVGFDQGERQVDAGAHAGRGPDLAVVDEDAVH